MFAADALDSLAHPGGEPDPGGDIDIILCRCQLSFAKLLLEDLIACKLSSDNGFESGVPQEHTWQYDSLSPRHLWQIQASHTVQRA